MGTDPSSPRPGAADADEPAPPSFLASLVRAVVVVAFVGAVLFAVAGVWPPLVVVESESMHPSLKTGDLVLVTEPERYAPAQADPAGVVTTERARDAAAGPTSRAAVPETASASAGVDVPGRGGARASTYGRLGGPGDVLVFAVPGTPGPPIIHRARFHVEAGENWYDRADPAALPTGVDSCAALPHCPAPHAGYVTKGDGNELYDQAGNVPPIRPTWVRAKGTARVPWLGWIRLVVVQGRLPSTLVPDPVGGAAPVAG
jgi:signal peptidase